MRLTNLLVALVLTSLALLPELADAVVVNVNGRLHSEANPVEIVLEAGTYRVTPIGTANGGVFNSWNAWASTTCSDPDGCISTCPTTFSGWKNSYSVLSPDITWVSVGGTPLPPIVSEPVCPHRQSFFLVSPSETKYHADDGLVYPTSLGALTVAQSSFFTLGSPGSAGFAINDSPSLLSDNQGGMSLNVVAAAGLDHFMLYGVKVTKKTPKFVKFGPVLLTDQFQLEGTAYNVITPQQLGLPANKNAEGVADEVTHLTEYKIKAVKGVAKFEKRKNVRVANQCNDLLVEVIKPTSLLVPTNKDLNDEVVAPDPESHNVDHFLCYKAKAQKKLADGTKLSKFPKGIQVEVADQFESEARRYDLKKITKLCNPVDKSGDPLLLAGRDKGTPKPITPAAVRNPDDHLVCYNAVNATKSVPQRPDCGGCEMVGKCSKGSVNKNEPCGDGITTVCDGGFCDKLKCKKGEKIHPKQPKHDKRIGIFVNNQFGPGQLDTNKETEFCIPSEKLPPP